MKYEMIYIRVHPLSYKAHWILRMHIECTYVISAGINVNIKVYDPV